MLAVYVEAPFAAFRTFTAGWFRPTATFLTPSAAYGLLLNFAGIESRLREEDSSHDGSAPASLMRKELPSVRLALGTPKDAFPTIQSIFQQLHNYPVGASGRERAESTHGNKFNITPVRREVLVGLRAWIVLDGNIEFEERVRQGIRGDFSEGRYGLPFLGDNAFLLDRVDANAAVPVCHWYEQIKEDSSVSNPVVQERATRMTMWIDRADWSRTKSALFAPSKPSKDIPSSAWVDITPPQS